jgi:hypothetical protein
MCQMAYADGSANTIRPTEVTYPNGREVTYDYGAADSIQVPCSLVAGLIDSDTGATRATEEGPMRASLDFARLRFGRFFLQITSFLTPPIAHSDARSVQSRESDAPARPWHAPGSVE